MILVQNLLQLLSGNKIVMLLLLGMMFSSCGGTRGALDRPSRPRASKTSKTTKVRKVKKNGKVKEVEWTESKDAKKPPIINSKVKKEMKVGSAEILKESVYDITYFIPFDASSYNNSTNKSDRFIQYYSGLLVATEILEREGISLNINVVDEKKRKFENILVESVTSETDVIIGPYSRNAIKVAAKFAKERQIPLVSPWQASKKIAKDNPYYIQLRPNLDEHYYSIFEDIKKNFNTTDNVYIVGRRNEVKDGMRIKKLQRLAKDVWGQQKENVLKELLTIQDSIDYGMTAFDSVFVQDAPIIMIIPNWSFKDEAFVYGALRRLSVEKGMANVIVYGMPIMLESDKINFDYYSSLKMRVARSKFVDESDYDVSRFKRDFVEKYGSLPTADAYEGYDNLMFIGRNLKEYGKNFQFYLYNDTRYYLQAAYKVEPTRQNSSDDKMDRIDFFENKNVDIIEFENNRFVRNID